MSACISSRREATLTLSARWLCFTRSLEVIDLFRFLIAAVALSRIKASVHEFTQIADKSV